MPVIHPYTQQIEAPGVPPTPQPDATAFGAQVASEQAQRGRALEALGEGLQRTGDFLTQREGENEVSDLTAQLAENRATYTNKWQEALKSGEDPETLAETFLKDYRESADKIRQGVKTRAGQLYFDRTMALQDEHFVTTAYAGQAELVGEKHKTNFQNTILSLSAAVQKDPYSYSSTKAQLEDAVSEMQGHLKQDDLDKLKRGGEMALMEARFRGLISKNPVAAEKELASGVWDTTMPSDLKHQLLGEAHAEQSHMWTMQEHMIKLADRQHQQEQDETLNDLLDRHFVPSHPDGPVTTQDVWDSGLDPEKRKMFYQMVQADNEGVVKNPELQAQILGKIMNKEITDDMQVWKYVADRKLAWEEGDKLAKFVNGKKTEEGARIADAMEELLKTRKQSITGEIPGVSAGLPAAQARYFDYFMYVKGMVDKYRKEGKDPMVLFQNTEGNKEFLGSPEIVSRFQLGFEGTMKAMTEVYQPKAIAVPPSEKAKANPRKPGETPAEYLKRLKGGQ